MRLVTFVYDVVEAAVGVVVGDAVVPIAELGAFPPTMPGLIADGPGTWQRLREAVPSSPPAGALTLDRVRLLAPIPRTPKNVMALGLNYADHAAETSVPIPEHLMVFTKAPTTIVGPYADIPYDPQVSTEIDWEVELGVVVGVPGRGISADDALEHVFGYLVVNDITARDIQRRHRQFFLGKSLDGSCPMGPWIVTADEIPDPQDLRLRTWVNGNLKQDGTTEDQILGVADILPIISRGLTLEAGDIIATGTPAGVGVAREPQEFLKPGDVLESEVEGIGRLRNRIVGPAPSA